MGSRQRARSLGGKGLPAIRTLPVDRPTVVHHGDALKILRLYPDGCFPACVCDPPWEILPQQAWDVLPTVELWREVFRVLVAGGLLVAIAAPQTYGPTQSALTAAGFEIVGMSVWAFATGRPPSRNLFKNAHAPIIVARKPGPLRPLNLDETRLPCVDDADRERMRRADMIRAHGRRRPGLHDRSFDTNVRGMAPFEPNAGGRWPASLVTTEPRLGYYDRFFLAPQLRDQKAHPAAKPVRLVAQVIRAFTQPGEWILDPFSGGGSTAVAAIATGRRCVAIEKEAKYVSMTRASITRALAGDFQLSRASRRELGIGPADQDRRGQEAGCLLESPPHSAHLASPCGKIITSDNEHLRGVGERETVESKPCLLTLAETATKLKVSTKTVQRMVARLEIECIRVGRQLRFDFAVVLAALAAGGKGHRVALRRPGVQDLGGAGGQNGTGRQAASPMPARARQPRRRGRAREGSGRGSGLGGGGAQGGQAPGGGTEGGGGAPRDRSDLNDIERRRQAAATARLFDDAVGAAGGDHSGPDDA